MPEFKFKPISSGYHKAVNDTGEQLALIYYTTAKSGGYHKRRYAAACTFSGEAIVPTHEATTLAKVKEKVLEYLQQHEKLT